MLLFLSILGIFLSLILLYYNARNYRSSMYLGLFFLFTSLYGLYQYILLYSKSVTLISLFLFNLSLTVSPVYLIGPMLYWYVRSILNDNSKLKKRDLLHLLPMVIYFISALPNAFIPWHEKVEVAKTLVSDLEIIMIYKATFLSKFFPAAVIYLVRLFLILGYTLWSIALFSRYSIKKKSSVVFSKQHFMKKWLFILLSSMLVLVISQLFLVAKSFQLHFSDYTFALNLIRVISVLSLIGLLISPFFFPSILYGLPRAPENEEKIKKIQRKNNVQTSEKKQTSGTYESDYLKLIGQKVSSFMENHQLYLESDCNLAYFSKRINIPPHHLAYYFREVKKQRFNDFRNEWRISHAKTLIQGGKASEMTLEAIGLLSGFSSRNAFITDFKKVEGISPGVYASRFN